MGESAQAVLALLFIVGVISSVMVVMMDGVALSVRAAFPAGTVLVFGVLLWSLFRKDKLPDQLGQVSRRFFERDGFCFAIVPQVIEGCCYLYIYFQSRYDRPCRAQVVLRPSKGFFLTRPDLQTLTIALECPGAAFGVARVPWAVPDKFQGKTQALDVAANVSYPEGKGSMVRYRGGIQVGKAATDAWKVAFTVAAAMAGHITVTSPAKVKLPLPRNVFETVPDDAPIVTEILWQPASAATPSGAR